jgi:hypothetical protein
MVVVSVLKLLDMGTTSVQPEILRAWEGSASIYRAIICCRNEIGKENTSTISNCMIKSPPTHTELYRAS